MKCLIYLDPSKSRLLCWSSHNELGCHFFCSLKIGPPRAGNLEKRCLILQTFRCNFHLLLIVNTQFCNEKRHTVRYQINM